MPTAKTPKRPRLDAVLRHIRTGSYDDEIGQLQEAIAERQEARQERVRKMVKQVYGEGYDVTDSSVTPVTSATSATPERPNPFLTRKAEDPDWAEAEARARAEEEALRSETPSEDDVSNSPIIGAIDISATTENEE